jgi:hypothetical protein
MWIGRNRKARVTYGFDEIALVPGRVTINPNEVDIAWRLPRRDTEPLDFKIPILASAMDGVVDVRFAIEMSKLGGLAVLNLEGVQTRYKNPKEVLQKIVEADKAEITGLLAFGKSKTAAPSRRSVPFRNGLLNSERSRRKPGRTFSSSKAPSPPSGTFLRSINRSTSRNSAGR